jgi:hypothetical protein
MNTKFLFRIAGFAVVGVSLYFVVRQLISADLWHHVYSLGWSLLAVTLLAACVYGGAGFLIAVAWARILESREPISLRDQTALYGISQIAKYAPGNIFHFVGRHAGGRRLGHSHGALAWAGMAESLGLVLAAGPMALAGWFVGAMGGFGGVAPVGMGRVADVLLLALVLIALIAAGAALWAALGPVFRALSELRIFVHLPVGAREAIGTAGPGLMLVPAYLLQVGFFAVAGCVLWLIAGTVSSLPVMAIVSVISIAATAWILGYLVPGAAAGVGVREAVLIVGLTGFIGVTDATIVAVAYRVATIIGDMLFFGLALALRRRQATS